MKRIWGHVISLALAGSALGAVLPSCATNDQSIFVRGALAPSATRQNGSCTYTNDPAQPQLFAGVLDVGLTDSYRSILLIGNQLIPRGDNLANRAESNRVHINGGVVRVTEPDGSLIREFTSLATGFADPQNNNTPAYGVIGLITFDAPTRNIVLNSDGMHPEQPGIPNRTVVKTVVLNIKVFGKSLGGEDIESDEYQFPLQVCRGCLVAPDDDPAQMGPHPNCKRATAVTATTFPCQFGQDEGISCSDPNCTADVCKPAYLMMP